MTEFQQIIRHSAKSGNPGRQGYNGCPWTRCCERTGDDCQPEPWPGGARWAVAMTWDMAADSAFNWYNKDTADNLVAAQSWTRYDPLIAIPRLVEQFARRDLRLTFFVPGWVIEKYPAQIDLLLKNGHEIALRGYLHER